MKKSKFISILLAVAISLSLVACAEPVKEEVVDLDYVKMAKDLFEKLNNGQFEDCIPLFSDKLKEAMPADKLKEAWETTVAQGSTFIEIEKTETEIKDEAEVVKLYLAYSAQGIIMQVPFDKEGRIIGLWFNYYNSEKSNSSERTMPEGIEEKDIVVGEGEIALAGKLTATKGLKSKYAVVLVHGSGPQDMDETAFANKPFRDIAWGLAVEGIDVLRYNKRTFSYPEWFAKPENAKLSVKEETIEDAVKAAKLLTDMGYEKVYLLGHSLGGMLAPRIYFDSGELFSGIIIMAGSTRNLTEIIIDQNNNSISTLSPEQKQSAEATLNAELEKLEKIDTLTDQQLLSEQVLGMPGYYIKEMNSYDTADLAARINKPILVQQGEEDFQVFADIDYPLWQEALKGNEKASFKLYPGLTHFFTQAPAEQTKTVKDYQLSQELSPQVISDIVDFIKSDSK